jgi:hypothetical protein
MFICIYKKVDNIVYQVRNDSSVPQSTSSQQHLLSFCADNEVQASDYALAELPYQKIDFVFGKYTYANGQIVVNPAWVEPPRVETANIPVADPGAPQ